MANAVMMTSVSMPATKPKAVAPMIAAAKPEHAPMAPGEHGENVPAKILVTTVRAKPWVVDTTVLVNRFVFVEMGNGETGRRATILTSVQAAVLDNRAVVLIMRVYKPGFVPMALGAVGVIVMKRRLSILNPLMTSAHHAPKAPTAAAVSASVILMAAAFVHNIV